MGASATLASPALTVDPGGEAVSEIKVINTGSVVDQFVVDVLGEAAAFARVEPNVLNLFPGAEGTASLKFLPPRAPKTPAGLVPFGIRVWSKEDPEGSTVQEGQLEVGSFLDTSAELLPRTSRGSRKGKHELAVDNRGNTPLAAGVSIVDPDELVNGRVTPPTIQAPPGSAVFHTIEIIPKRRFLRGPAKTIPFQVIISGEGQPPMTTDGALLQEQILPKWLLPAALLALAGLIVGFVLWQTLLKPQIKTAAREAAEEETEEVQAAAQEAQESAAAAEQSAAVAEETAAAVASGEIPAGGGGAGAGGGGGGGAGDTTTTVAQTGLGPASAAAGANPVDFRLTSAFAPNPAFQTVGQPVPDSQVYQITDIVFQNPAGDSGQLQIRRGDTVLYQIGLANFRDYDYHFVTPLRFTAGQQVILAVQCQTAGNGANCTPAASFSGFSEPSS